MSQLMIAVYPQHTPPMITILSIYRTKMLGLNNSQNSLVIHNSAWAKAYEEEQGRLALELSDLVCGIEHYGSTAVAGLKAKPIIDILVAVQAIETWILCAEPIARLGYEYFAEARVEGHHVFTRGSELHDRTHLVHIVQLNSPQWHLNLAFRDLLRQNSRLREQYQAEKERASAAAPSDRVAYNTLKSSFISAVMADLRSRDDTS